jgi:hypothetical protein
MGEVFTGDKENHCFLSGTNKRLETRAAEFLFYDCELHNLGVHLVALIARGLNLIKPEAHPCKKYCHAYGRDYRRGLCWRFDLLSTLTHDS